MSGHEHACLGHSRSRIPRCRLSVLSAGIKTCQARTTRTSYCLPESIVLPLNYAWRSQLRSGNQIKLRVALTIYRVVSNSPVQEILQVVRPILHELGIALFVELLSLLPILRLVGLQEIVELRAFLYLRILIGDSFSHRQPEVSTGAPPLRRTLATILRAPSSEWPLGTGISNDSFSMSSHSRSEGTDET